MYHDDVAWMLRGCCGAAGIPEWPFVQYNGVALFIMIVARLRPRSGQNDRQN
jgi:hypothetical protein